MTNHRSVAFSCLRLFIMERVLGLLLKPSADIPIKYEISGGTLRSRHLLNLPESFPEEVLHNPEVIWNYQRLTQGTVVAWKHDFARINSIIFADELYAIANLIKSEAVLFPSMRIAVKETTDTFLVPLREFSHSCFTTQRKDQLIVSFENR